MLSSLTKNVAKRGRVYYTDKNGSVLVLECVKCSELKTRDEFPKDKKSPGGARSRCRDCSKLDYLKNREKHLERAKRYRNENLELCLQRERKYREKNREKRIEYSAAWYESNKDYFRDWYKENKGSVKSSKLRRRALENDLPYNFTKQDYESLLESFSDKCALTGMEGDIHIDHVIPLSTNQGGTYLGNLIPVLSSVNLAKGDKNFFDWFEQDKVRLNLCEERFKAVVEYLAELNEMTVEEYRTFVYECHDIKSEDTTKEVV